MLRRPFSVFEVLRDDLGTVRAISILNKRAGRTTGLLYDLEAGDTVCVPRARSACPSTRRRAARPGWWPAASAWRRLRRWPRRWSPSHVPTTLFYGARTGEELYYLEFFDRLGVDARALAPKTAAPARKGRVTGPLEASLQALGGPDLVTIYACGPEPMLAAVATAGGALRPAERGVDGAHDGLRPGRLLQLRRAGEARRRRRRATCGRASADRCSTAPRWCGTEPWRSTCR